ncbi:hypothetical protein IH979_00785 [Patescibacteria group bacterium]|nr:hypothetical protein [Patescibacteria group bacterium]
MILAKKHFIYLAIFGLFLMTTYVFLLAPAVSGLHDKHNFIRSWTEEISTGYIKQSSLVKVTRELERYEEEINSIYDKAIIRDENTLDFIKFLEEIGGTDLEQTIAFDANQKTVYNGLAGIPIEIKTESTLKRSLQYVHDLESSDYYVEIRSLTIERPRFPEDARPQVHTTIVGLVYSN